MSIESEADWKGLRAVGRVVRLTLDALERHVRPGITTRELDAIGATVFAVHRARSAPAMVYGFPGTVLISVNDEIVHGVPGARRLEAGDLVKLDVTAEKGGFVADAARTLIVGSGSETALRLRACVRAAFAEALRAAHAGNAVAAIGAAIQTEVRRWGFSIVPELGGHGTGRTIHEAPSVPNFKDPGQQDVLTEGLVVAVEPIVIAGAGDVFEDRDGWTIRTKDGSWAAHYEHTLVITRDCPVLLTAA